MKSNVAADSDLHTEIILLILSSYFMNYDNEEKTCLICIIVKNSMHGKDLFFAEKYDVFIALERNIS